LCARSFADTVRSVAELEQRLTRNLLDGAQLMRIEALTPAADGAFEYGSPHALRAPFLRAADLARDVVKLEHGRLERLMEKGKQVTKRCFRTADELFVTELVVATSEVRITQHPAPQCHRLDPLAGAGRRERHGVLRLRTGRRAVAFE